MIRPVTCLCLLAACASGLYLYSEKHRTELLDREIGRVIQGTKDARARTNLLRAEWALLNEPGRLEDMAGRYLNLHPMAPAQFVQLADLPGRLPAPQAAQEQGSAEDDEQDDAPKPVQQVQAAVAQASPPAHTAVQVALKQDPHPAPKLLAHADIHHTQHKTMVAERQDAAPHQELMGRSAPIPLASPTPVGGHIFSAMARPARTPQPSATLIAPAPGFAPNLGSALGTHPALPPPVPYGR